MLENLLKRANATEIEFSAPLVKEALEEANKQAAERLKNIYTRAVQVAETQLTVQVTHLRHLRDEEKRQVKRVHDTDRLVRYFAETGNPLPLVRAGLLHDYDLNAIVQQVGIKHDDPLWKVPEDWQPKQA